MEFKNWIVSKDIDRNNIFNHWLNSLDQRRKNIIEDILVLWKSRMYYEKYSLDEKYKKYFEGEYRKFQLSYEDIKSIKYWQSKGYSLDESILIVHDAKYDNYFYDQYINYFNSISNNLKKDKIWTPFDSPYYKTVWKFVNIVLNNFVINYLKHNISSESPFDFSIVVPQQSEANKQEILEIAKKAFLVAIKEYPIPKYKDLHHQDITLNQVYDFFEQLARYNIWDKVFNKLYSYKNSKNIQLNKLYYRIPNDINSESAKSFFEYSKSGFADLNQTKTDGKTQV